MPDRFDLERMLVVRWRWRPLPPLPLETPLPVVTWTDADAFRASSGGSAEAAAFQFSFPQLSRQTADLHFYRLIQLFNTPLRSLSTLTAGRSGYGHWHGAIPAFKGEHPWAHLWFFRDEGDGDLVVVEYGFDAVLTLRSERKSAAALAAYYQEICRAVNAAVPDVTPGPAR